MAPPTNKDNPRSKAPINFSLPAGCTAEFVGEGQANAVFRAYLPDSYKKSHPDFMKGKLLRVAKVTETDPYPPDELQEFWEGVIQPLFDPNELVQQCLVRIEGSDFVKKLARILDEHDHREARFKGTRLNADAKLGMLVEDMSQDLVLEFKPKWLGQSPSAPDKATRCRNCANEEQKHEKRSVGKVRNDPVLCPLDLLHSKSEPATLELILRCLPIKSSISDTQRKRLVQWLRETRLFERLKSRQLEKDRIGPLTATLEAWREEDRDNLALAMTLRDCSCFVRIPANGTEPVQAKLADLDRKNAKDGKLEYWRKTEESLREYYFATIKPARVTNCRLESKVPR